MIYTSFVTKTKAYEKVLNHYLLPSLKKFNLTYDIDYIEDRGCWANNILYKAKFLLNMLNKHKQSIVSLDSDAEILKYPSLFDTLQDVDIALHYLDNGLQWNNRPSPDGRREALGGTLYVNYNKKMLRFLEEWVNIQKVEKNWPQKTMQKLLQQHKSELNIYNLPYAYSAIIKQDNSLPLHMIKKEDIVILHNQVSRRLRRRR